MPISRNRNFGCVAVATLLAAAPGLALADEADVSKGRDLARDYCAGCHEMADGKGREVNGRYVPSFPEIAGTPHYSLVRLRRIIAVPPHSEMPKMSLEPGEIDAIARFIQSLRKRSG